jgi:hypothetical protein
MTITRSSPILITDNFTLYDRIIEEGDICFGKNAYFLLFLFFDIYGIDDTYTPQTGELVYLYSSTFKVKKAATLKSLNWLKENDYIEYVANTDEKNPCWSLTKHGKSLTISKNQLSIEQLQELVDGWNNGHEKIKRDCGNGELPWKWFINIPRIQKSPSVGEV